MAELNLCIVANRVLGLLRSTEVREIGGSLGDSYQRLEQTISRLAPLLLHAENKSLESNEVRDLVLKLGEALYDADNFLEAKNMGLESNEALKRRTSGSSRKRSSIVKKVAKKVRAILFPTSFPLQASPSFSLYSYSEKGIEDLIYRVEHVINDQIYGFNLVELSEKEIRNLGGVREEVVAGSFLVDVVWDLIREKDKIAIMDMLFDVDGVFEVLPIVCEPEIGKTMLESCVLNDERVQSHFDLKIWVDEPEDLESRMIVDFIVATRQKRRDRCAEDSLQGMGMGCLIVIVLADVRFEDHKELDSLAQLLRIGAPGSKILVITRVSLVEDIASAEREYRLECLSEEESLDLFKKITFRQGQEPITDSLLTSTGKEVAKSCKEHPHAITAIGSLLYYEDYDEIEQWFLCEKELIPLIEKCKDNYPLVDPFLNLSYKYLPSPLKHCFAYCSLFPIDNEIDVQILIKLWMANDFIVPRLKTTSWKFSKNLENIASNSDSDLEETGYKLDDDLEHCGKSSDDPENVMKSDEDLEDIGYEYFLNLLRRSFFHEAKLDVRGRVTKCRIHHPLHKLATCVSGSLCCLLFTNTECRIQHSSPLHVSLAHSSLNRGRLESEWHSELYSHALRSLIFPTPPGKPPVHLMSDWDDILSQYSHLRALDMHDCGIKIVPNSIGKLKHLKYLDLSQNKEIMELPDSITKLLNLQTLRLSSCSKLLRLPRDIENLVNLRHLEIDGCYCLTSLPRGFGQLTNLRTLSHFILSEDDSAAVDQLNVLGQLSNLREVKIKNFKHRMGDHISTCLKNMQRVHALLLEWESREPNSDHNALQLEAVLSSELEEFTLNGFWAIGGFSFLPSSPTNLVKLSLKRIVKRKILPPLDHCVKLKMLLLDEMIDLEYISGDFSMPICPSLEELWLTELPKLKSWWEKTDSMPLEIQKFPSFPCLPRLVIEDCPNLASMPTFPTLVEGLVLDSTSWELFRKTMNLKDKHEAFPWEGPVPISAAWEQFRKLMSFDEHEASTSTSGNRSPPLSKLKNLCIVGIEKFDDTKAEEIPWETLGSLRMLKFDFLPDMTTLPEGLQHVTSLRELHIWRCGTKTIPEWIEKLELLERLVIRACPNMKLLPANIRSLKKLRTLEIEECPTLQRRCEKETGADWEKVERIPIKNFGRISTK